ncbi:helix-turn-helix domain-containing protein [Streptomyces sp. UNOC14_S4]|uniref:helix-turn-helix domain-containing protein n=1 Tax=Streptomyces sp. UNOC14_S4 TaxID=2872340 RepID=UPI001E3CE806|nr:helix-turn-helix domain-containing protein [Streptomyces sp. UNOC14_S4]MCC3766002.1 helix-turn-helix domain-containing protein [Streptomyces sp. UNOC14_S4]
MDAMLGHPSSGERLGPLIRMLREAKGWTEDDLAKALIDDSGRKTMTRTEVWRWEVEYEGRTAGPLWLPHLANVLDIPVTRLQAAKAASKAARRIGHLTTVTPAEVLASLVPPDDPFSPLATHTGRRVGKDDAEALLRRVHGLRLADDVLAGGDLVETCVRELRRTINLYNGTCHTEKVGKRLLTAVAEMAQLAGWVATDTGGAVNPEPLFRLGASAARQAQDGALTAHLLGSWGYWQANTGNPHRGVELVRTAEAAAGSDVPLVAKSLTAARLAWVNALAGDDRSALRHIGDAMQQIHDADPEEANDKLWLYWVDIPEQEVMQARVATQLHRPLRAVPLLRRVLDNYDPTHVREYSLYLSWLVTALLDANEIEEAAVQATRMFEMTASVPSSRASERGQVVLTALRHHRQALEVEEVLMHWDATPS